MNCARAISLFSSFCDGELDDRRRHAVEGHLSICRACADEYEQYKTLTRDLHADLQDLVSSMSAPPSLWSNVRESLTEQPRTAVQWIPERAFAKRTAALDRIFALARTPICAVAGATALVFCLAIALSVIFSTTLRQPNIALTRTQTKQLVAFKVRRAENGKILTDAKSRRYVLVLDARERWLR